MSEDFDKACRAIFYAVMKAKTLQEARNAVKITVGPHNVGLVMAQLESEVKEEAEGKDA